MRPQPLPVFVFVHGGSWSWGDPDDYNFVARAFAPAGFVVVLAGYRLGEDGRYPAMLEDTAAAIVETARLAPQFGGDSARIVIAGHSAGAYDVVQVALEERWLAASGLQPAGVIGLSGPYDFYPFDKPSSEAAFGSVGAGRREPADQPCARQCAADAAGPWRTRRAGETAQFARAGGSFGRPRLGAPVETKFYPGFDHNAPLISLASPWRRSRDVDDAMIAFAHAG